MRQWKQHAADYLRLRRQLGAILAWDEHLLGQYTTQLLADDVQVLTTAHATAWAQIPAEVPGHPTARAARRLRAVKGFATYMHALDSAHQVPPHGIFEYQHQRVAPYIYTEIEIAALVNAAGQLARGIRAHTYPTLFGLLASTGLRIGEALGLQRDDVDLNTGMLVVSSGKFRHSRLVPLHASATAALQRYSAWRTTHESYKQPSSAPFFINRDGDKLPYANARKAFLQATTAAGIHTHRQYPRMHDLRHAFSVKTLLGWYRNGEDVAAMMPALSTYLGHNDPANTYWYLSAVPELLAYAADRLNAADPHRQVRS
ncbi:tyrosine-type recombinase/integrase [Yaniella flava]|uniref:Tyrosine-type recombinase/integrase n=1 Tax=Yaniella flava TaxID=287930 RepID=A0ABP5GIN7_9MICC